MERPFNELSQGKLGFPDWLTLSFLSRRLSAPDSPVCAGSVTNIAGRWQSSESTVKILTRNP
jgi:hypothetical protein